MTDSQENKNIEIVNNKLTDANDDEKNNQFLGDRMKQYEEKYEMSVGASNAFIIRLDGSGFSKFTKGLKSPFDTAFVLAMQNTMNDLLLQFPEAKTGYTHSDEITLIFPPILPTKQVPNPEHVRNGRICKTLTIVASYCSVRFNHNLIGLLSKPEYQTKDKDNIKDKFFAMTAHFDARIMAFDSTIQNEIVNHMIWRSVYDCQRNSISTFARDYYSAKELYKKNGNEMIAMMAKKGLDWNNVPIYLKHGIYAKKLTYSMNAFDKKLQKDVIVQRTKIVNKSFKIFFDSKFLKVLLAKYWNDVEDELKELFKNDSKIVNIPLNTETLLLDKQDEHGCSLEVLS